jgi:hypothetical protein
LARRCGTRRDWRFHWRPTGLVWRPSRLGIGLVDRVRGLRHHGSGARARRGGHTEPASRGATTHRAGGEHEGRLGPRERGSTRGNGDRCPCASALGGWFEVETVGSAVCQGGPGPLRWTASLELRR